MADYTQIRVYKTAKILLITAAALTKNFAREYRYTIGQDFYKSIVEFMVMIHDTYSIPELQPQLESIVILKRQLQYINIYIRLCCALHLFSKERYAELTKHTSDIDKQLTCWSLSIQRKIKLKGTTPQK